MTSHFWTEARVETLKARWKASERASVIAKEMGATRDAVLGKLYRLGFGGRMRAAEKRRRLRIGIAESYARGDRKHNRPSTTTIRKMSEKITMHWPRLNAEERSLLRAAVNAPAS